MGMLVLLLGIMNSGRVAVAQETAAGAPGDSVESQTPATLAQPAELGTANQQTTLRFSFDRTPWRDVIEWVANQADLALHVGEVPTGSFTYSDPDSFTPQEAIERINLFLLPQGFALIRSGRLLSLINLSDARSTQQLEALARTVSIEELQQLDRHDVVKCIFALGEIDAQDAVEELNPLQLMTTPRIFSKTNRIMVIDTVGKLNSVKAILDAFEPSELDGGLTMRNFALKHVSAEDLLIVVRPHLGLATGEMIGIDVSLSADPQGKNIFVTGAEDKVALIEGLISQLDKPQGGLSETEGESELRSHPVTGGNVELVYDVLQTLLAGKTVRLSMDKAAGSIVALAAPAVQEEIAQTVMQLQAAEAQFEVIPLKTVDPYFAISLIEEMLDLPDPLLDDSEDPLQDAPRIDADPANMRLFVHGKASQIKRIKEIIEGLDASDVLGQDDVGIRLFPMKGQRVEQVLQTAARFWRGENPVFLYPSAVEGERVQVERVVTEPPSEEDLISESLQGASRATAQLLTGNPSSSAAAIRCQLTERGLLLQSEDATALDQFFMHLQAIAGPVDSTPSPPIVFYLKYTKSDDAIRMLAELLDGGESALEGEAGTLVNGYVASGAGSFLGSLITTREGTLTMTAGSITVVSDSRLNRLIAQGAASDLEKIESYLKIIDKDNSMTSVEIYGTAHVIELQHTKASEVAETIREAYADRVAAPTSSGRGSPASPQRPSPRDNAAAARTSRQQDDEQPDANRRSPERRPTGQTARNLEPRMTIAVHEPSNSLIVTAPEQLYQEVEQLVKLIDSRNEQAVEVIQLKEAPVETLIRQLLSNGAGSSGRSSRSSSRSTSRVPESAAPSSQRGSSGR
jgi:type II secretory pathway component GspD/PulD (secretin)